MQIYSRCFSRADITCETGTPQDQCTNCQERFWDTGNNECADAGQSSKPCMSSSVQTKYTHNRTWRTACVHMNVSPEMPTDAKVLRNQADQSHGCQARHEMCFCCVGRTKFLHFHMQSVRIKTQRFVLTNKCLIQYVVRLI